VKWDMDSLLINVTKSLQWWSWPHGWQVMKCT